MIDVSLLYDENSEMFKAWAIASNGDALYRRGVSKSSPAGSTWEHIVANNQPLVSISICKAAGVWAVGRNGALLLVSINSKIILLIRCPIIFQDQLIADAVFHRKMSTAPIGRQSKMHQKEPF